MNRTQIEKVKRRKKRAEKAKQRAERIRVVDLGSSVILQSVSELRGTDSHPKCYANFYGNCGGGISREHFLSKNILKKFDFISPKGIPWLSHLKKDITDDSLTTKCLCADHNSFLSPFDAFAGEAFDIFYDLNRKHRTNYFINGYAFEYWILKTLIGTIATGQLEHNGKTFSISDIPKQWIEILFEQKPLPTDAGLLVIQRVGDPIGVSSRRMRTRFLFDTKDKLCGLSIALNGFEFFMNFMDKSSVLALEGISDYQVIFRPITIHSPQRKANLQFIW